MSDSHKVPRELDCINISNDWKNWKRDFMVYMIANNKNTDPEATKIATFLWLIGTEGANIYNTLFPNDGTPNSLLGTTTTRIVTPAVRNEQGQITGNERIEQRVQQRTLEEVLERFDEHCLPQRNVTMESFKFNNCIQKERQSFSEFLTELRAQLDRCDYLCDCGESYKNRMLRDRIITGVYDKKLQLKLLDGRNETLERIVEICRTFETANVNKEILNAKRQSVASMSSKENNETVAVDAIRRFCYNCGGNWDGMAHKNTCKAKEYVCKCGKTGHFPKMCRKNNRSINKADDLDRRSKASVKKVELKNELWAEMSE